MSKNYKRLRKNLERAAKATQDVLPLSYIDYVCENETFLQEMDKSASLSKDDRILEQYQNEFKFFTKFQIARNNGESTKHLVAKAMTQKPPLQKRSIKKQFKSTIKRLVCILKFTSE